MEIGRKWKGANCMKKSKGILAITVILALAITGCGTDNSGVGEKKAETTAKVTDNQETESQKADQEKTTEESEETEMKKDETIVKEDEKAVAQQTVSLDTNSNTSDKDNASNNSTSNSSSDNNSSGNGSNSNSNHTGSGNGGNTNSSSENSANSNPGNTSNSNPTPAPTPAPAPAQHQHTWVHVDATGHYETVVVQAAWDETVPVYGNVAHEICNDCGADLTNLSEDNLWDHIFGHADNGGKGSFRTEWRNEQTGTKIIHHDAVTEQRWVQDAPAYDVCSGCGATK